MNKKYNKTNKHTIQKNDVLSEIQSDEEINQQEEQEEYEDIVIGIDLGTRFSCVSIWRNKKLEIISDHFGNRTLPSVVAFYESAKLVGHNALSMKDVNPGNTIYDIKRIIGRRIDDPAIDNIKQLLSYNITDDESDYHNIMVQLDDDDYKVTHKKRYRPEEICAYILIEIKRMAAQYLHQDVNKAIITVPAFFNDAQRQATLDAAKIAGLNVLKIINEPTAAALAYGFGDRKWNNKNGGIVLVYDFGAGTLDLSLMQIINGVFRVLAIDGNGHLGGEDIDYLIMNHILLEFQKKHRILNMKMSKLSQIKLKNSVETAKKILSTTDKAIVCVDDFYNGQKLYYVLTKEIFEMICNQMFILCIKPIRDIIESVGMTPNDIDDVILVGGSTRIPKIQKLILDFFKGTKIKKLTCSLNPDEVVSAGASIYGYTLTHHDDPFSQNLVLFDITPLSLGVETLKKQMTVVIPRNTVIPTRKTKVFSTDSDFQDSVIIKIFEGERKLTKNNFHVGTFELSGFDKGPRGYPIIRITFHIDINGILHVTAHEKRSDVQNTIKITSTWGAKGRLSRNEIDNIINEAEKNEEIDMLYSTKIGLVHKINSTCNSILVNLKDDEFSLTNSDKKKIKMDIKNNLKWLNGKEFNELDMSELESREKRLSKMYAPLIAQANKQNMKFKDANTASNTAEIHGEDDYNEDVDTYEKITIPNDPSEYEKEEIKALKKTIFDLGKNIMTVINNPVSKFDEDDINIINDYIGSVNIWLYTTSATTTIEFMAKIDEINKFTDDIMKKYNDENLFEKNENFTAKDELQLTCITLNESLRANYFSLKETDAEKLKKSINDTMMWLLEHQNERIETYKDKVNEISELCNQIYHSMYKFKEIENLQNENNDSESDDDDNEIEFPVAPENNKINEKIEDMLEKLPDKITKPRKNDVMLKINLNKLSNGANNRFNRR